MDTELAHWLVSEEARSALAEASAQSDPGSLAAGTALRRHWPPDRAAAALTQVSLRRRAVAKFGDRAAGLFFTPDGLEQATRAEVAAWRAGRLREAGAGQVVDVGCGIGADALALLDAGVAVVAVEADPGTAILARANLGERATVVCGDARQVAPGLLGDGVAVFVDPARRTTTGRSWRVADFSPPWDFVVGLLDGRLGCMKAAPGLPSTMIPDHVATTWVSHRGDLVEASLWSGPWRPGTRTAVLLPSRQELDAGERREPPVGPVGRYVYEPDPAVIRSGAVAALAQHLLARCPQAGIAYLFADDLVPTPFATAFEVREDLPFDERVLRRWVQDHGVGILELKVRGLDVDPAVLRKRLKPAGRGSATVILSPTGSGARALVVERLSRDAPQGT